MSSLSFRLFFLNDIVLIVSQNCNNRVLVSMVKIKEHSDNPFENEKGLKEGIKIENF